MLWQHGSLASIFSNKNKNKNVPQTVVLIIQGLKPYTLFYTKDGEEKWVG